MTREEWDKIWWEEFRRLRKSAPTADLNVLHKAVGRWMEHKYGPRPAGETGPPWWLKLGALTVGVQMDFLKKVWAWLDGRKTFIAALIAAVPVILDTVRQVIEAGSFSVESWDKIAAAVLFGLGVLHKIIKALGLLTAVDE